MTSHNYVLIGESSWDLECAKKVGFSIEQSYLHNDFFSGSNKSNSKLWRKILIICNVFLLSLRLSLTKKRILYSSFNSEVMLIAILFSARKKNFIFCPNLLADPKVKTGVGGQVLRYLFSKYASKIFVTDEFTFYSLKKYMPSLTQYNFKLNIPDTSKRTSLLYVVAMPAVLSHNYSSSNSDIYYEFLIALAETLSAAKLQVCLLPHPREEGELTNHNKFKRFRFITSQEIAFKGAEVCYVGAYSSLVLNKRYGGGYGFWCHLNEAKILPAGLEHIEDKLVDLEKYILEMKRYD